MILDILIFVFIGIGLFFNLLAGIGLLRFPDVYTRLHAGTKCTTFGSIFLIGSVVLIGLNLWWENDTNGSGTGDSFSSRLDSDSSHKSGGGTCDRACSTPQWRSTGWCGHR